MLTAKTIIQLSVFVFSIAIFGPILYSSEQIIEESENKIIESIESIPNKIGCEKIIYDNWKEICERKQITYNKGLEIIHNAESLN